MRRLQKNLSDIEPLLYDSQEFNAPKNQEFLKKKIHQLAATSEKVQHNPTIINRDPTVRFVASNFASNLQRADQSFTAGKTDFSRYQLMKVTSSCVQCHTRLQQGPESNAKRPETFLKKMPVVDQAQYLIASRKFGAAYDLLLISLGQPEDENIFSWKSDKSAGLALQIAVQYEQDSSRAMNVINKIQGNPTLPYYIKTKANNWTASIARWKAEKKKPVTLEDYRRLLASGQGEIEAMRVIPGVLKLLSSDLPSQQLGEALLLAGESYEIVNDFSPMDLHENYYESCIRNVPHTPTSKKCYQRLEDSVRMGYTGSSGTSIPVDVEVWLKSLKNLSEKF
jgi:hypothetical protein